MLLSLLQVRIALQDFKERLIGLWELSLMCLLGILLSSYELGLEGYLEQTIQSVLSVTIIALSMLIYIFIKTRSLRIQTMIGSGDVILLFGLSLFLSVQDFLQTVLISCAIGLAYHIIQVLIKKSRKPLIPFAGILCSVEFLSNLINLIK